VRQPPATNRRALYELASVPVGGLLVLEATAVGVCVLVVRRYSRERGAGATPKRLRFIRGVVVWILAVILVVFVRILIATFDG
jgi:multisubunit Na+/H+ antiporter MnhB subunit